MARTSNGGPGHGTMVFMMIFKFLLLVEGAGLLALAAAYYVGLHNYQTESMPYTLQPGGQSLPYWPINSFNGTINDFSNTNFYYSHSSRSQLALGALTFLHALISMLTACCCLKKNVKRLGFFWTVAGFLNALTGTVAVTLTFTENGDSARQFPDASQLTPSYWVYGKYSMEEWVCGNGAQLVNFTQSANGYNPLGGSDAVNDFSKYCKEAEGAKWLSVLILLWSIVMMTIGLWTFFSARKIQKMDKERIVNKEQGPAFGSYSSGEESYTSTQKPPPIQPY